jgi:hypothetical protein
MKTGVFRTSTNAFEEALVRFHKKISSLATEKRWGRVNQPDTTLTGLERSIDKTFMADYCLIGGLDAKYLVGGSLNLLRQSKLVTAVGGGRNGKKPSVNRFFPLN